jgi:hypothetical protein
LPDNDLVVVALSYGAKDVVSDLKEVYGEKYVIKTIEELIE